jgi:hypothetical protein
MTSNQSLLISRFAILLMGSSTIQQQRKQFVRVSAQLSSIFPALIASVHQFDPSSDCPGAWNLALQQHFPAPMAAAILRHLPLAFDDLEFRGTVVAEEAPEVVTMIRSLSVHMFNHTLCESYIEGSTPPEHISPICLSLSVSPELTWVVLEQKDAGNCLAMCCKIAASYSSLELYNHTTIPLNVIEAAGERRITFSILRQVSYSLLVPTTKKAKSPLPCCTVSITATRSSGIHLVHTPRHLACCQKASLDRCSSGHHVRLLHVFTSCQRLSAKNQSPWDRHSLPRVLSERT